MIISTIKLTIHKMLVALRSALESDVIKIPVCVCPYIETKLPFQTTNLTMNKNEAQNLSWS